MRKISVLLLAFMLMSVFSFAQDDDKYTMFNNTRFVVKTDKYEDFGKAIANHNKTWHASGPAHVNVWYVAVGKNAGDMVFSGGPMTFADVDNNSLGEDHMKDWLKEVMPNIKYIKESNYWKMDNERSYSPNEEFGASKLSIAIYDLKPYESYRFKSILDKVVKVYKEKEYDRAISVYWPEFRTDAETDVAIVWPFEKYAMFDEDNKFKPDFEEVHGAGSWQRFIDELRDVVEGRSDEVWELIPEFSGSAE